MSLPCRVYLNWGFSLESELTLTYPMMPWEYADGGEGGHVVAASGIPESFVIREDDILLLRLRVHESELPAFRVFLRWARSSGEAFTIGLDADLPSTEFSVYLNAPTWDASARVEHRRDPQFNGVFIIPLEVRPELGGTFDVSWFELATQGEES